MENSVKTHLKEQGTWVRFLYMVLYAIILSIMDLVLGAVVILQVILTLFTGSQNERARRFGGQIGLYACQIYHFLTYYSETKPFPFSEWPTVERPEPPASTQETEPTSKPAPKPAKKRVNRTKKKVKEAEKE